MVSVERSFDDCDKLWRKSRLLYGQRTKLLNFVLLFYNFLGQIDETSTARPQHHARLKDCRGELAIEEHKSCPPDCRSNHDLARCC